MDTPRLYHADIVQWLCGNEWLAENGYTPKYHAFFGDTPYFLGSISKRFGSDHAAPAKFGRDGAFQRQSRGFMGATWDGFEDVYAYQAWVTEWASLMLKFAHPGAVAAFFGGTRTYHRVAAGLEDAGWEIFDCVAVWMYGSGFPKSLDIERVTQDTKWVGYGTALKPSYEPLILARAPRAKLTYAELALRYSTGTLNIDGGRIGSSSTPRKDPNNGILTNAHLQMRPWMKRRIEDGLPLKGDFDGEQGRFPANTLFVCECEGGHAAECPISQLDQQSGESGESCAVRIQHGDNGTSGVYGYHKHVPTVPSYPDSGGASRFFYQSKASSWEREAGLEDFGKSTVSDGREITNDTPFQRGATQRQNIHPTVKPIQLTEYISRLLLPPPLDVPRRLLIPFAGVGSEMIGAQFAGWDEIDGVELTAEYVPINEARRQWWRQFASYEQAERAYKAKRQQVRAETSPSVKRDQLALF